MKSPVPYPFYKSLRFRFGLIFGFAFLCFLLIIGFLLYSNVKNQFEKSFAARLKTQANLILQETEINPITIPFPASGEYFSLTYLANQKRDTLFNNLPENLQKSGADKSWQKAELTRTLETGGELRIQYVLPSAELNQDIRNLQVILFFYFPLAFLAALIVGYFLSGFLLRPIENIVSKANDISLQGQIHLLDEPAFRDELHQLTVSLNRMLAQIQKQAQYQNAFFASASHELRTPLSVMLTELQTLQDSELPQNIKPIIASQTAEVQRLGKLVNDFLLLSQLKSGVLILNKTSINLAEITLEILERFTLRAQVNSQNFKIEFVPEDGDFDILTDRSHLTTILLNLFENGIKHGVPGTTITTTIEKTNQLILVSVRNYARNQKIDLAALQHAFSKQDFETEGFGLGLWIVARLCETIGARFHIHFEGSYFIACIDFENMAARSEV